MSVCVVCVLGGVDMFVPLNQLCMAYNAKGTHALLCVQEVHTGRFGSRPRDPLAMSVGYIIF